jgi:hypothetical protein
MSPPVGQGGHRLVAGSNLRILDLSAPFSSFEFCDTHFQGLPSVRRLFSLARSFEAQTLVVEEISPQGIIAEEITEIATLFPDYQPGQLKRLSFWRKEFKTTRGLASARPDDFIGYALLKQDIVPSLPSHPGWHVFESVFPKYDHRHNCVPCPGVYHLTVGGERQTTSGLMYCQQNQLNKACAQVAIRSLLSRLLPEGDISYRQMNAIAQSVDSSFRPENGLTPPQMQAIFSKFDVSYTDIEYEEEQKTNPEIRNDVPYQKYLYSGIESGCGGLLGFSMSGPQATTSRHIIPFFGHTFNKDTWAPDADVAYFNVGGGIGYVPSESWTSSFIGHDDNFGANFCVPRLYVDPEQVQYVVEFRRPKVRYGGVMAEAQALQFLYSVTPHLSTDNAWTKRLVEGSHPSVQQVVLRAVCVSRHAYLEHLGTVSDWAGQRETHNLPPALEKVLPETLWVVEISLPQLFPANERKLGEIVLHAERERDPAKDPTADIDYGLFLMARFPGEYILQTAVNQYGPSFAKVPSRLQSHVDLINTDS